MKILLSIILLFCLIQTSFPQKMEVLFCADFSGSTNGMVVELQKTIWATMNKLEADNSSIEIRYGLVGFGRISFGKDDYYSKVIHDMGTPVNDIGYSLVKLQLLINGCEAYPQKAINDCLKKVSWSQNKSVKKMIVIIGNGGLPMKQMEVEVKKAKKKGILINPIFFKPTTNYSNGIENWKSFAKEAGNKLVISEPNNSSIQFKKYYDESFIASSGNKFISTYLPYGALGRKKVKQLKEIIDKLKVISSENFEEMLIYQSSKTVQGSNTDWDLVDMFMVGRVNIRELTKSDLPLFMQGFTNSQIEKYIGLKVKERKLIVSKLRLELSKRNEFLNRKEAKSKHFLGKGGLSSIIQNIIQNEVEQLQVITSE